MISEQEWFIRNQISDLEKFIKTHEVTGWRLLFTGYPAMAAVEASKAQLNGCRLGLAVMLNKS